MFISLYFTIGPAINCGKNEIYRATFTGLFDASVSLRYTSTIYEIAWKVKNEIPIGSDIFGIVNKLLPTTKLIIFAKKPAYLK